VATVAVFLGLITAEIRADTYSKSHYIHQKNAVENPPVEIHHTLKTIDNERIITNYSVGARIKNKCEDQIQNLYLIKNKLLLVVDSLGIFDLKSIKPHWVFLRQSPKINLNRLIDSLSPELIIWDGSNYKSDQERWKLSCKAKKIPFHQTSEKGAFIIDF
jgi:competence protein ComEC